MMLPYLRQLRELAAPGAVSDSEVPSPGGFPEPEAGALPSGSAIGGYSPTPLAYLGDAVYELYVRVHLVERLGLTRDLQAASSALVRASAQARVLDVIEDRLTPEERDIVRRGRNAGSGQVPKRASMSEYRRATALECLLGHLLVAGREERIIELLDQALTRETEGRSE
jgi:ribonuclease-3 family protein